MDRERSSLTRLDDDRCDKLRWKGMYVEAEWDPCSAFHGPPVLVP